MFFTFAFPILFLVIFSALNPGNAGVGSDGVNFVTFFAPGILAFGIVGATYTNLAIGLSQQRDNGLLKRVRGTPLPRRVYMAGQILSALITSGILAVITLAIGIVAYGLEFRVETSLGFFLVIVTGTFAFCTLGLAVTTIIPNGEAAPAVVNALLFPIVFISGVFFPLANAPDWVQTTANLLPLAPFVTGLQYVFSPSAPAPGIPWGDIGALVAWGAFGLAVALKWFRWESRRQ